MNCRGTSYRPFLRDNNLLCPIHTADADAKRQNSFVASASAVCIGLYATSWWLILSHQSVYGSGRAALPCGSARAIVYTPVRITFFSPAGFGGRL